MTLAPTAVVMNMYYTGLGIARSLGEHGIPVIGLTSQRGVYGNFTRYAKTVLCPDSRNQPEQLLAYLLEMGKKMGSRSVIFPTRDDDVLFLDRFRRELDPFFIPMAPESSALRGCLDKWETYLCAQRAGVATPRCWLIEAEQDLLRVLPELTYPCVLKPVVAHDWRKGGNWDIVGQRKAVGILSRDELLSEYTAIARANQRVLLQEMIPGGDDGLAIAACYLDRESNWVAGFNTQKLLQVPEGFGTGCIVQAAERPELFEPALRLLRDLHFTGIAEVEFKWSAAKSEYQLIEINPRPWDQHRLGKSCGTDLVYLAYCDYAGLARPPVSRHFSADKWIAEDTFVEAALRLLLKRDAKLRTLFRLARGKRIYAIWSARDPLPLLVYWSTRFIPRLIATAMRGLRSKLKTGWSAETLAQKKGPMYERHLGKEKGQG
jgi:predicted ATP-grasp superfamily ATP-dependent carboligase